MSYYSIQDSPDFKSKITTADREVFYYGFRYYLPDLGRWLNRDTIGERGGLNVYGFVGNSPLDKVDAFGKVSITSSGVTAFPTNNRPDYVNDSYFTIMDENSDFGVRTIASMVDSILTAGVINHYDASQVTGSLIANMLRQGSLSGDTVHTILSHSGGFTNAVYGIEKYATEYLNDIRAPTELYLVGAAPKLAASSVNSRLKRAIESAGHCLSIKLMVIYSPHDWGIPQQGGLAWPGAWDRGGVDAVKTTEISVPVQLQAMAGHDAAAHFGTARPNASLYGGTLQDAEMIAGSLQDNIKTFLGGGEVPSTTYRTIGSQNSPSYPPRHGNPNRRR